MAKGHVALLILYSDQRIAMHSYLLRFLDQISAINVNENKLSVMKIVFDGLDRIILVRDDYFECGEHLLIGNSIVFLLELKYETFCQLRLHFRFVAERVPVLLLSVRAR